MTKNIKISNNNIINEIKKKFGEESIMQLSNKKCVKLDVFSTGIFGLDLALGIGGYPKGRIIEIYGPEASGKTSLTLSAIAQAQKAKMTCAFIDAEHALDPDYATKIGVNVSKLIFSQPDSGEHALSIVESLVKTGAVDLIIVDSVAALVPQVELDGEMSDQTIGAQARLMSKALRKLSGLLNKHNATIIFINQIRMKIGVLFGNPETTSGGKALKFYSTIRLEVRGSAKINENSELIGNEVKIKVVKNKVSPPFKRVQANLLYGKGFDNEHQIIVAATNARIVEKSGSWYSYKKEKLGQGLNSVKTFFKDNPKIKDAIEKQVFEFYFKPQKK